MILSLSVLGRGSHMLHSNENLADSSESMVDYALGLTLIDALWLPERRWQLIVLTGPNGAAR